MRSHLLTRAGVRHPWTDGVWPVLAGSLAAVGLFGAGVELGLARFVVTSAGLSLFAVSWVFGLAFSLHQQIGRRGPLLVRTGLASTAVVMALFGLTQLFDGYGLLAGAAVAMTSPRALRLLQRLRKVRGLAADARTRPAVLRVRMDQEMVDREFEDMVAGLSELDDHPPDS